MNEYKKLILWISSAAAAVTISLNFFYSQIQIESIFFKIMLILAFDFITYSSIYSAIWNLYKRVIWKRVNKSLYLKGRWYHVHIIDNKDDYLRIGEVDIGQDFYNLEFSARNYNVRYSLADDSIVTIDTQCTTWTENAHLDKGGHTWGIYTATRTFGNFSVRKGAHSFSIVSSDGYASEMYGYFQDMSPYNRVGVIKLFRDKNKRDEYVKAKCKEVLNSDDKQFISNVENEVVIAKK